MTNILRNKNILVTGGTGTIGSVLVMNILQHEPGVVRVLGNDENGLFNLAQELQNYPNVRFLLGDVKDKERLRRAIEGIDFVFHAAALKHVPLCEYNPFAEPIPEAIETTAQHLHQSFGERGIWQLPTPLRHHFIPVSKIISNP